MKIELTSLFLEDMLRTFLEKEKIAYTIGYGPSCRVYDIDCTEQKIRSEMGQWKRAINQLYDKI